MNKIKGKLFVTAFSFIMACLMLFTASCSQSGKMDGDDGNNPSDGGEVTDTPDDNKPDGGDAPLPDEYGFAQENLFIGDSYVDKYFWTTFDMDFPENSVNEGVGGTKVQRWIDDSSALAEKYNPENIVVHIGVNDVNLGASDMQTSAALGNMFTVYLEKFPEAQIWWTTIEPNNYNGGAFLSKYESVNAAAKRFAEDWERLQVIDTASLIGGDGKDGKTVSKWYNPDGLHFNSDGYALWADTIRLALGKAPRNGTLTEGFGDGEKYYASSGFRVVRDEDGDYAENVCSRYNYLYFKDAKDTDIYAEANLYVGLNTQPDQYSEAGIALRTETRIVFFFIDINTGGRIPAFEERENKYGHRYVKDADGDWTRPSGGYYYLGSRYNQTWKDFAIMKSGGTVYFMVHGQIIFEDSTSFSATDEVEALVIAKNVKLRVKNPVTITGSGEVGAKLASVKDVAPSADIVIDGLASNWNPEILANKGVYVDKNMNRMEVSGFLGESGVYLYVKLHTTKTFSVMQNYSGGDWYKNPNIEFNFEVLPTQHLNNSYVAVQQGQEKIAYKGLCNQDNTRISFDESNKTALHDIGYEIFIPYQANAPKGKPYLTVELGCQFGNGEGMFEGNPFWLKPSLVITPRGVDLSVYK